jgi:catechol 2,3-dioxygenase-like lactoylglutathione lyase family enzyme
MGKKIVHVEFPAQDLDRAEKFWEAVGGWSIEGMGMPGIDYRMYQEGDQGGGVYAGDGARSSTTEAKTSTPTSRRFGEPAARPRTSSRFPESAGSPGARTPRAIPSGCSRPMSR